MSDVRKNIDEITRTLTVLTGLERLPGRDALGDFKTTVQDIIDLIAVENQPIGTIQAVDTSFPNTPAVDPKWTECNGSIIPIGSVYSGYRTRNLNGANVNLSVTWTADGGGAYATLASTDITGVNVGDWVSGTGISSVNGQPAMVIDITGTVITINDTAANGAISSTFTNDGVYIAGGASGSNFDTLQNHWHEFFQSSDTGAIDGTTGAKNFGVLGEQRVQDPITDGSNGDVRTGNRTRPHTRYLKYYMKTS